MKNKIEKGKKEKKKSRLAFPVGTFVTNDLFVVMKFMNRLNRNQDSQGKSIIGNLIYNWAVNWELKRSVV